MASISAFMTGGQRQYPSHYMETSISTYVDACRQHQFATRATLFGVEAFKSQGMYSKAAFALLKMTGEVGGGCILQNTHNLFLLMALYNVVHDVRQSCSA